MSGATRKSEQKRGLGRGLSALLGEDAALVGPAGGVAAAAETGSATRAAAEIPIDLIAPNPDQPRRRFDEIDLAELAASIAERGVIQPVILRPDPVRPGHHQIVAGERRWRAAQMAGLHSLPAVVRPLDDRAVLEIALVENVQRADLNPLEEAHGYAQLIETFSYTQEDLARVIGKSRSHLANLLRLLALPEPVRDMVRDGSLSAGAARAVATAPDPVALARAAVAEGLTVRQVEARARAVRKGPPGDRPRGAPAEKDADTAILEGDLSAALGMAVRISHGAAGDGGEVRIRYKDLEALDRLCQRLAG